MWQSDCEDQSVRLRTQTMLKYMQVSLDVSLDPDEDFQTESKHSTSTQISRKLLQESLVTWITG